VEIAGALWRQCRVLILDEATAALSGAEAKILFDNMKRLQRQGVGVLYISHRIEEIRQVADRVTVLRDGRRVGTHPAAETPASQLVLEMAGHERMQSRPEAAQRPGKIALRVRGLRAGPRVRGVDLEVRHGEVLGLAGLVGSGRTETLRAIFGAEAKEAGQVLLEEKEVSIKSPAEAVRRGMGLVPEDRKQDGLLAGQSIRVNTTLASLGRHARQGWLNEAAEAETTNGLRQRLGIGCQSIEQPVSQLSGGNQQKVVLARWLARECEIYLLDEPTRGIDVAAKEEIHQLLRGLAAAGKAVVVVSSELAELMEFCHVIAVICQGRVTARFSAGQWSEEKITRAAFSHFLEG
jgi:ribose transport system ATP-binding protein